MSSEVEQHADFSAIRYAQCWEDADILLGGLDIQPGDTCLSIASAGDNSLSLLTQDPARVVALDLNPAQLACLELRVAAYRELDHGALLELIGSHPSERRRELFLACRPLLSPSVRAFWDANPNAVEGGMGNADRPVILSDGLKASPLKCMTTSVRENFFSGFCGAKTIPPLISSWDGSSSNRSRPAMARI